MMSHVSLNKHQHRSGTKDWFFLGTPGYGAPFHIDEVRHPSWQAQIKGVKIWYDVLKELNI